MGQSPFLQFSRFKQQCPDCGAPSTEVTNLEKALVYVTCDITSEQDLSPHLHCSCGRRSWIALPFAVCEQSCFYRFIRQMLWGTVPSDGCRCSLYFIHFTLEGFHLYHTVLNFHNVQVCTNTILTALHTGSKATSITGVISSKQLLVSTSSPTKYNKFLCKQTARVFCS